MSFYSIVTLPHSTQQHHSYASTGGSTHKIKSACIQMQGPYIYQNGKYIRTEQVIWNLSINSDSFALTFLCRTVPCKRRRNRLWEKEDRDFKIWACWEHLKYEYEYHRKSTWRFWRQSVLYQRNKIVPFSFKRLNGFGDLTAVIGGTWLLSDVG